ncbi:MAG: TIGR01459 family HAD-type hydrolase [Siculibacillus sp.]|nr:TIGR01459 family HAD-type hydrolase [Siculibacillus sp.]
MLRSVPPLVPGLSALATDYDVLISDVWGVVHNGLAAHPGACEALVEFRRGGGRVVLLTNAPRPSGPIHAQLASLGVPREAYDDLVTSGDVTRETLMARPERRITHVGPERDLPIYDGLPHRLVADGEAEIIVCSGLVDDLTETPEDYRGRLAALAERGLTMLCANPDLIVERGHEKLWCAGALAALYAEAFGGEVTLIGKPHSPVYAEVRRRISALTGRPVDDRRVLAIGDGLPTDIRGAVDQGLDVLFVTAGIHGDDFGPIDAPDPARVVDRLAAEGLSATAYLPRLVW